MTVKRFLTMFLFKVSDTERVYYRFDISEPWRLAPAEFVADPSSEQWKNERLATAKVNSFFTRYGSIYIEAR